jgi:hypothetical protein
MRGRASVDCTQTRRFPSPLLLKIEKSASHAIHVLDVFYEPGCSLLCEEVQMHSSITGLVSDSNYDFNCCDTLNG